jgi:hypothetical protein
MAFRVWLMPEREANVRSVYRAAKAILACGLLGAAYGAIAGAAYGTVVVLPLGPAALIGTVMGLVLGSFYGFVAGIVGGCLGGPIGWSIGGLTGGVVTLPLLSALAGQPGNIHQITSWIWNNITPGLIGAAIGLALGRELQRESSSFPAVRWLRGTAHPCTIGEWLWWRRGGSDALLNPPDTTGTGFRFQMPGWRTRWALILCLGGALLVSKSWHDDFRGRLRRPVRFLIPSGYVGWVQVQFGEPGAPPLPIQNGFYVAHIPSSGFTRTSTHIKCGLVNRDEFYEVSGDHSRLLDSSEIYGGGKAPGSKRMVRTQGSGYEEGQFQSARIGASPVKFEGLFYFIGTTTEFHRAGPPPAPLFPDRPAPQRRPAVIPHPG